MVRAACYETTNLLAVAFESLQQISLALKTCKVARIRQGPVGADAHIGPLRSYKFSEDFRKNAANQSLPLPRSAR